MAGAKVSHMKTMVIVFLAVSNMFMGGGLMWVSGQSKIEPYLAVVDKTTYQVHVVGPAEKMKMNDEIMKGIVEHEVRSLFENLRMVIADSRAQKGVVANVYSRIAGGSGAAKFISEWYVQRDPFKLSEMGMISLSDMTALPLSDQSWQVEWTETERNLMGEVQKKSRWKGVVTYVLSPPTDKTEAAKNPVGFYATQLSWTLQGA